MPDQVGKRAPRGTVTFEEQLADGAGADADDIVAAAARYIARYKLPKEILFCPRLQRSPSGKADHRWAKAQVAVTL